MSEDQLPDGGLAAAGLGVRHPGDRRLGDRRKTPRTTADRRRRDRRAATIRSLLLSALTFAMPHQLARLPGVTTLPRLLGSRAASPQVVASITSFEPVDPAHAYDDLIQEAADTYRLEPVLIRSVMRMESAFDPFAVSRAGAQGLMQLMPDVAAELGVSDPFDPRENIMGGARLLRALLDHHHGNLALTLASYNAGPAAVARHGNRVPPFRETRKYVRRITEWVESSD
jgi:soluble lytic murein transglycosylase-like protein